jgi:hypothetical protein
MTIEITEEERQLILLALASLEKERPGFDYALTEIAKKMGESMYQEFKKILQS